MSQSPAKGNPNAAQPSKPPLKEIKIIDVNVEKCGKLAEDSKFQKVREDIKKQNEDAAKQATAQKGQSPASQPPPNEGVFFRENDFDVVADFKAIPPEEVYCRVSEGCVEIGAIHKETQGTGADARHIDLQLTRLYQTPKAINTGSTKCYLSSDGVLVVNGTYKK